MLRIIRKKTVWIGAATLVVVVFFFAAFSLHDEEEALKPEAGANLFPFVRSLEGTRPDGEIKVTAGDALVIDAELRRMFDYYLSAVGEKSLDAIRAETERELERTLQPGAAGEAKRLLARYMDYKRDLVDVEKNPKLAGGAVGAVRARFHAIQEARARFFSAKESQALFGFDDAYDLDAVARLEITQDKLLTNAQKQEKIAALDAALPPALREARDAPLKVVKLEESVQKMRTQGASEDDIYRMRATALSPEAASRLAEVDLEETTWKNRIASYLAERNRLNATIVNLPETDRLSAVRQLREARFTIDEQKRLPAYE